MAIREEKIDSYTDNVLMSIKAKLKMAPRLTSEHCIYRFPPMYRKVDDGETPLLISIGPFHYGLPKLQPMELHKWRYFEDFLNREPENPIDYYLESLKRLDETARRYYGEPVTVSRNEFLEMMLFDGCFIIEFMLKTCKVEPDTNDPIFSSAWMEIHLKNDLKLLENQLPFFVTEHLFKLNGADKRYGQFLDLTLEFFSNEVKIGQKNVVKSPGFQPKHFLDLLRKCYVSTLNRVEPKRTERIHFIPHATELHEAGVKFQKQEASKCFLDVKFTEKGVFSIPPISIDGNTEDLFRNLIAYEHFDEQPSFITDYTTLMDSLINTPSDVALLRRYGILNNWLGEDKDVTRIFNSLGLTLSSDFYVAALYENVNAYYNEPKHVWRAILKRDYFNSPWSVIALVGSSVILICTVIQAVCSIISLNKQPTI